MRMERLPLRREAFVVTTVGGELLVCILFALRHRDSERQALNKPTPLSHRVGAQLVCAQYFRICARSGEVSYTDLRSAI